MYKRDLGILLVAAFAVYFSLQDEGTFSFRKAWWVLCASRAKPCHAAFPA
jgi:hypothetical protein